MKYLSILLFCLPCVTLALGEVNEEKEERLKALLALKIEELGEISVKLDDVFDIFDGLLKKQKVKLASGISQSIATAPASTSVITAQDIEAMGARSLEEILETVPGLHVSLSDIRFEPFYDVRGMHSANNYEILLMVDGVPIKSIVDGSRGVWMPPPVQFIQRIEVIRGPGSALYGADAVSGVINIITKIADDVKGTEIGGRVGSFQTYQTWLLHGSHWNGLDVALSLDYVNTNGYQEIIYQDAQSLLDKATGTHVSQTPGRAYLHRRQLSVHGEVSQEHWQVGFGWTHAPQMGSALGSTLVISPEEKHKNDEYQITTLYHNPQLTEHWEATARLNYQDSNEIWISNYSVRPGGIRDDKFFPYGSPSNVWIYQRHTRLDLSGQYRGFRAHTLSLGIGYVYSDLYNVNSEFYADAQKPVLVSTKKLGRTIVPENIRQNSYAFIQDSWKIGQDWELTAGVRYDWYSDFNATTNPRLALVWQTSSRLTTKLLYGSAFRAPSFAEMYTPQNSVFVGNPNLKAETSHSIELAFDYRANDDLNLTLNLFHYQVEDKILRRFINPEVNSIYTFDNMGTLDGDGVEIENRWKINHKSSLLFNYAYTQVKTDVGDETGNYPHHQIFFRYDWLIGNHWFLDARLNWVADRDRPVGDLRDPLKDYTELDLTFRYKDSSRKTPWEFAIGGRNLLDQDRREPGDPRLIGDYPKAGREFFGEVRYKF